MNVNTDVINLVQSIGCGTFGKDLYFGRVPSSKDTPSALWWIVPVTANNAKHNVTGEDSITYQYELYYRTKSIETLNAKLFKATQELVGMHCYELDNFTTMSVDYVATHQATNIDPEDRVYGWIVFTVKVYNILVPKDKLESENQN